MYLRQIWNSRCRSEVKKYVFKLYQNQYVVCSGCAQTQNSRSINSIAAGSKNIDKAGIDCKRSLFEIKAIKEKIEVL